MIVLFQAKRGEKMKAKHMKAEIVKVIRTDTAEGKGTEESPVSSHAAYWTFFCSFSLYSVCSDYFYNFCFHLLSPHFSTRRFHLLQIIFVSPILLNTGTAPAEYL